MLAFHICIQVLPLHLCPRGRQPVGQALLLLLLLLLLVPYRRRLLHLLLALLRCCRHVLRLPILHTLHQLPRSAATTGRVPGSKQQR